MAIIQSLGTNEQELEKQENELKVQSSKTDTYTPLMTGLKAPIYINSNNSNGCLNIHYMDSDA